MADSLKSDQSMTQGSAVCLLIVEDSSIQREVLRRVLKQAGYDPVVAKDGAEGLKLAMEHRPRLVISDIAMPNMDGYQMCQAIKQHPELRQTPVMLLTELSDPREIIRGLDAGADNYLTKPYDEKDLLTRIGQLLEMPSLARENEAGLAVSFAGEEHVVTSNRHQILTLLLSTYENAVHRNRELIKTQMALRVLNEHLEEKVQERTKQLEDANRAKTNFISNMSHELRTPMNAIIGMTELCLLTPVSSEQRNYLEIVRSSSNSLLYLLNSLLDFSRLEGGNLTVHPVTFSLRSNLREWMQYHLRKAAEKGVSFSCFVGGGVADQLLGDAQRIREILYQLLSNAVKFTQQGHVTLRVTTVEQSTAQVSGPPIATIRFSVQDTGMGIPHDQRETIFDSFAQGDGSVTRRYGGTGLGLTLTQRLVGLIGGSLAWESRHSDDGLPVEKCGSVFQVTVPLQVLEEQAASWSGDSDEELLVEHVAVPQDQQADFAAPPLSDPATMSRERVVACCHTLLVSMGQDIAQHQGSRLENSSQWLKKAMDHLEVAGGREELLRLLLATRKENWQEAANHLATVQYMLANY